MKGFQLIVPLITLFFDKSASADKVILIDASKLGEEYKDANGFKKLYLLYHQYFAISSQAIAKLEERKMPQGVAKSSKPIPQAVGQLEEKNDLYEGFPVDTQPLATARSHSEAVLSICLFVNPPIQDHISTPCF